MVLPGKNNYQSAKRDSTIIKRWGVHTGKSLTQPSLNIVNVCLHKTNIEHPTWFRYKSTLLSSSPSSPVVPEVTPALQHKVRILDIEGISCCWQI